MWSSLLKVKIADEGTPATSEFRAFRGNEERTCIGDFGHLLLTVTKKEELESAGHVVFSRNPHFGLRSSKLIARAKHIACV